MSGSPARCVLVKVRARLLVTRGLFQRTWNEARIGHPRSQVCETCGGTAPCPVLATPRERAPRRAGIGDVIAKARSTVKNKMRTLSVRLQRKQTRIRRLKQRGEAFAPPHAPPGLTEDQSSFCSLERGSAVAVTLACLAVGMAAVLVEPTPMSERRTCENSRQDDGKQCFHGLPPIDAALAPQRLCNLK